MIERLISVLAPHHCVVCGDEGSLLCFDCSQTLTDDRAALCIKCSQPCAQSWLCNTCKKRSAIDDAWIGGYYEDGLKKLMKAFKFNRAKNAHTHLSYLIDNATPQLFTTSFVVNVPTIRAHVRQRGYDHAALIAKSVARHRHLKYSPLLDRRHDSVQVGASRAQRFIQAKDMFTVPRTLSSEASVLLIDDVVTTSATVESAAVALKAAGVSRVYVAACAYDKRQL